MEAPREALWIGELIADEGYVTSRVILTDEQSVRMAKAAGWRVLRYTLADPSIAEAIDIGARTVNPNARRGFQRRRRRYRPTG
jgi:thiazole synthase ThiGH ThiG subunit